MKKYLISITLILCMVFQSAVCFAADTFDTHVEGGKSDCEAVDLSIIPEGTDIDSITTTSINPWMKQFHLTTPEQAVAGYKGGECGQKCFTITAAPTNPDLVLLGTDTETVWRSEDGGLSWTPSDEGIPIAGTIYMTFSPDDENIAFVSVITNESGAAQKPETGLYKSTDAGKSWKQVLPLVFQPRVFSNCTIKYSDVRKDGKRDLYACGTHSGMFKSEDEGETWVSIGLTEEYIESIDVIGNAVVACTQKNGLMITYDDGATWSKLNEGITEENVRAIAVNPLDENNWFVVTPEKLYESKDSGKKWASVCTYKDAGFGDKKFFRLNFSAVRDNGKPRLYVTSSSIQNPMRYSDDYGKTFNRPQVDNELAYIRDNWGYSAEPYFSHPANPDLFWISLDGQIMKSNDGGASLFPASSGYSGVRAANFYFADDPEADIPFWICAIDRGAMMGVYSGNDEEYPLVYYMPQEDRYKNVRGIKGGKTVRDLDYDPKNKNRIVRNLGTWNTGNLNESLDGGITWNQIEGTDMTSIGNFLKFNPNNPTTIYAGQIISYDDGKTWIKSDYTIHAMSPFNGNVVYSVTGSVLRKSKDEGRTWEILAQLPSGLQRVRVDIFKEDKLYIGTTSSGICVYEDGKTRMLNAKNGLTTVYGRCPIYSVAQNPENEKHLVAGGLYATYNYVTPGLFESYDGGETWHNVPGIQNARDIWIVEFRASKKQVWIGTSGGTYVYEYENFFNEEDTLYTDIDDSYAREEIISLYNEGFYEEFTDGEFNPKGGTTRGEFAKQISKLLGLQRVKTTSSYVDVEKDNVSNGGYVYPYVQSMYDAGLLVVAEDGQYNPDENLTYDQLIIIASRILNKFHVQDEFDISDIQEASHIPAYARYAYFRTKAFGILDDKISFESGKEATNEDIAHFIVNLKAFIKTIGGDI